MPYPHSYPPPNPGYPGHSNFGPPLPPITAPQDRRMPPVPVNVPVPNYSQGKRIASGTHPSESPAKKKQSKWSAEEDMAIIELRGNGMKWEDISKNLQGRSAISCRLRFQNYLERRSEWDEEKKNKLARLYERFKKDMWEKIAKEMQLPWRAAEAMHWQIGEVEMANRANVPVFHLANQSPSQIAQASSSNSASSASAPPTEAESNSGSPNMPAGAIPSYQHSEHLRQESYGPSSMSYQRRNSDASMNGSTEHSIRSVETLQSRASQQRSLGPQASGNESQGHRPYLSPFPRPSEGSSR